MSTPRHFDAAAIAAALSPRAAVDAIAEALASGYDPATDTARTFADTSNGQFILMPTEVAGVAGVKIVTVAPANPERGLPRIQANYLLFDAETLTLQATLDGTALTTLRTPAVSLAAVRPALGRFDEPLRVVVFGAGPQSVGHVQTLAAITPEPLASVTFLVRQPNRAAPDAAALGDVAGTDSPHARTALRGAHVIVCATTARTPLFPSDAIGQNSVVIAVGSHEPEARELDSALLARSTVIVEDSATALREAGDVILACNEGALDRGSLIGMSEVIAGGAQVPADRAVVFKSVGMSWQDLVIANAVVRSATHQA